jgi:hypothetical protein
MLKQRHISVEEVYTDLANQILEPWGIGSPSILRFGGLLCVLRFSGPRLEPLPRARVRFRFQNAAAM